MPLAWRGDMLSDGDGLTGEVRVVGDQTISIHFKFAFKWNGKVAWYYCGTWPALSMEQIRRQRDEARDLVRSGVNPNDQKKAERIENQAAVEATIAQAAAEASQNKPFKDMFDAWLADGGPARTAMPNCAARLKRTCCRCWARSPCAASPSTTCARSCGPWCPWREPHVSACASGPGADVRLGREAPALARPAD